MAMKHCKLQLVALFLFAVLGSSGGVVYSSNDRAHTERAHTAAEGDHLPTPTGTNLKELIVSIPVYSGWKPGEKQAEGMLPTPMPTSQPPTVALTTSGI